MKKQNIKLVFRYDDFLRGNFPVDEKIVRIFQKHSVPLVLGIVPCDEDEKPVLGESYHFLSELKKGIQNNTLEAALHGLNHIKVENGEFNGVNFNEQYRRIKKGKEILDSVLNNDIITFIPPWNAYDQNTLAVLEKVGFKNISSALCFGQSFSNPVISYYPHTLDNLYDLNGVLKNNKNRNGIVVVMLHEYDFKTKESLQFLENVLLSVRNLDFVKCVTFKSLFDNHENADEKRMITNMGSNFFHRQLKLKGVIHTTGFANRISFLSNALKFPYSLILLLLSKKNKL